ncbi:hypothetical protein RB595_003987 [Gaeumannomyces hyphopodioides]
MVETFGPEPPPGMRPTPAGFDAENAPNHEGIEMAFAEKVIQHMETYWKILKNKRGSQLRLTKMDDEIYEHLKADFPELDPAEDIVEDKLKNKEGKERWRKFMMAYEKRVEDFNFGTMLRVSPKDDVDTEERVIFGGLPSCAVLSIRASRCADSCRPPQCRECSSTRSRLRGTRPGSTIGSMSRHIRRKRRRRVRAAETGVFKQTKKSYLRMRSWECPLCCTCRLESGLGTWAAGLLVKTGRRW